MGKGYAGTGLLWGRVPTKMACDGNAEALKGEGEASLMNQPRGGFSEGLTPRRKWESVRGVPPSPLYMKIRRSSVRSVAAFTLIELLVVIAIIGVLMSLAIGGGSAVKEQARKSEARNDCTSLSLAIKSYYQDYSKYPVSGTKTEDTTLEAMLTADGNKAVISALLGSDTTLNPRGTEYYQPKAAKTSSGAPRSGLSSDGGLFDPWGQTYGILLDTDYDGTLVYKGTDLKDLDENAKIIKGGVGVFSIGKKDKVRKSVVSWQ